MDDVVAETAFFGTDPSGAQYRVAVKIGRPWPIDDGEGAPYARCPVFIEPLLGRKEIAGEDTYQALCLAIRFAQYALRQFVERGGRLVYPGTDAEVDLDAFISS